MHSKKDERSDHSFDPSKPAAIDIDDLPIPTAQKRGPRTFEQLLESNLKKEGAEFMPLSPSKQPELSQYDAKPKREFLKRKNNAVVATNIPPPKQYRYFINQFEENILEVPHAVE